MLFSRKKGIIANEACKIVYVWQVLCMVCFACFDVAKVAYSAEKTSKKI